MEMSNVHTFAARDADTEQHDPTHESCGALKAIGDALAILDAIDHGGLFEALPEDASDRARFQTGISLLDILEQRLRQATGDPGQIDSDECR